MPQWSIAESFIMFALKLRKLLRGESASTPLGLRDIKKKLGLDRVNVNPTFPWGGLPYINDGDARRNFQKKPLKITILGVAPANFFP